MPAICVLDKSVAELIAAGEVVERPASVVKELMENSIDAGAKAIEVEIRRGGVTYMRITDDGCGIPFEEMPTAFLRHATSKISASDDLDAIMTLGFRGEALASVAAVAKVELISAVPGQMGGRIELHGGEMQDFSAAGAPAGTTILVQDLFYNVPARMKFLKKDISEGNAVAAVVDKIALSHPEISITFLRDGQEQLHTPGDGQLLSAVYAVFGKAFAAALLKVDGEYKGIRVFGYISQPHAARPSRSLQSFFINGRFVKSRICQVALEEACKGVVLAGKYPSCVLNMEIHPALVDVNVHPAKTEVRFSDEKMIFNSLYASVKTALDRERGVISPPSAVSQPKFSPSVLADVEVLPQEAEKKQLVIDFSGIRQVSGSDETEASAKVVHPADYQPGVLRDRPSNEDAFRLYPSASREAEIMDTGMAASLAGEPKKTEADQQHPISYIGELFKTYLLVESEGEFFLIDKHAAHERILFNQMQNRVGKEYSQRLLDPLGVTLSKEEYGAVLENLDLLNQIGFQAEDFGNFTILVREAPLSLTGEDVEGLLIELADYLLNHKKELLPKRLEFIYDSIACRAAIKAGNNNSRYELEKLAVRVLGDPDVRYCPHGRPVVTAFSRRDVEKLFGRV